MSQRQKVNAAARREEARLAAEKLARQQQRVRGALIVIAAVLVLVAGFIIWRGSQATYLDGVARTPQGADTTGGIPVSADGMAGTAGEGMRLDVYVDVQSPASVAFWQAQSAAMRELSADGTIALWLHPVGFVDGGLNGSSTRAGEAAVVVADRAPQGFLDFLDAAFAMRADGAEKLNDPDLESLALSNGVSQAVADQFTDNLFDAWFVAATEQATRDGVEDTPTLLLDGHPLTADWSTDGALAEAVSSAG